MKEMLKEFLGFKRYIALVFLSAVGSVLSTLALPMYLSRIINSAIPSADMGSVLSVGALMLLFVPAGILCSALMGYFAAKVSVGIGKNLRNRVFKKVQEFSEMEFDKISTPSLITRTTNDVMQVQTFLNILLRISLMAPFMAIGGIVMSLAKSVKLSMVLLVSMPLLLAFVFVMGSRIMPLSASMQEYLDEINLVIREKLTGVRVARTFGTELYEEERFERVNETFMHKSVRLHTLMSVLMPGLNLILYGTTLVLLAFGGAQILGGTSLPVGDIIAIVQYVMQIMMSVLMISMVFLVYPRAAVSSRRINEVLTINPLISNIQNPVTQTSLKGHVSFRNVSFTFPDAKSPVLKDISFDSRPGEVTAIIGSTGSGKSTLINLIPRFYDVQCGEILVDGINVKEMDLHALRNKIGLVPQKTFLFKGSISQNVAYGNKACTKEDIEQALRVAQAYDFVMEKEEGTETLITQGATNISGGQKQRLAIARALSKKPSLYIFDDSFSALDFKTDAALRKALLKEARNAGVILVAQRVSTIKDADQILVLENGYCVGKGKHEDLLQHCKVYQEIVYSQLSKEEVQ
ncbi:MAG: ABC transporter ATP-binding protein [Filifactor alocis]|nr:ABC transporter ATP-binding protein [Filifactor alocis]